MNPSSDIVMCETTLAIRHLLPVASKMMNVTDNQNSSVTTATRSQGGTGQEIAAFTSSATFSSTLGLHSVSAYDTGHMSPSSRFAASWKPRVE